MSHPEMQHPDPRQAPNQIVTVFRQFANLIQTEFRLARAELSSNISRAVGGLIMFGLAALVALTALHGLAGAVVGYLIESGFSPGTAALIVAGVLFVVVIALVTAGAKRLSSASLAPTHTLNNLERDTDVLRAAATGESK